MLNQARAILRRSSAFFQRPASRDTFWWALYTLLGFVAPLLLSIGVRKAVGAEITLGWIAGTGQFALSSAGLLMTTYYFVARPWTLTKLPMTEWFLFSSVIGLIAGIALYLLATLNVSGIKIDTTFLYWPSIGLFVATLMVAVAAVAMDRKRENLSSVLVGQAHNEEFENMETAFDETFP